MHPENKTIKKFIKENDSFPNNENLPFILYKKGLDLPHPKAEDFEKIFMENGWINSWRNGIFDYHHYHSNTHEVLGVYSGSCDVQIGGDNGEIFHVETGDVLIIPVGVSHKNVGCSNDFKCVGAYPIDISYDINYGKPEEKEKAKGKIQKTLLPEKDPIYGSDGPLMTAWKIKNPI